VATFVERYKCKLLVQYRYYYSVRMFVVNVGFIIGSVMVGSRSNNGRRTKAAAAAVTTTTVAIELLLIIMMIISLEIYR